jgi:hypothetical protein
VIFQGGILIAVPEKQFLLALPPELEPDPEHEHEPEPEPEIVYMVDNFGHGRCLQIQSEDLEPCSDYVEAAEGLHCH